MLKSRQLQLKAAGADIDAKNKDGNTALMWAAGYNDNPEIVLILLNAGADAKDNEGKTVWDYAQETEKLKGTDANQKLKDATFE